MAIKLAYSPNPLPGDRPDVPRIVLERAVNTKELLDYMRRNTALEAADMRATFEQLAGAITFFLQDGRPVRTPFGTFSVGVHSSKTERSSKSANVEIRFRATRAYRDAFRKTAIVKMVSPPQPALPVVSRMQNMERGTDDWVASWETLSANAGAIIQIRGSRLHFDPDDTETGVFLLPVGDGADPIRCTAYYRTGTAIVTFRIPQVQSGTYNLEIRTRPTHRAVRANQFKGGIIIE